MLTDIFAHRYQDVPLRDGFDERDRILMVQLFRLLVEEVCPYWLNGKVSDEGKSFWTELQSKLSMELGLTSLSATHFLYTSGHFKKNVPVSAERICKKWMLTVPSEDEDIDRFISERLSLVELGFRQMADNLSEKRLTLHLYGPASPRRSWVTEAEQKLSAQVKELNERLRRADYPLHYHNGFLQFSNDALIQGHVEAPFWTLVAARKWANVDTDMKEALDRRDAGGRDPALYAARALESTIKIISGEKGWTHGKEKGAHNFIDNLLSKGNGRFIEIWEAEALKGFFTSVRNPLGHGPGGEPMPSLTNPQTDWAIAFCMAWIRSLIVRI